jgi:L-alanine-DL-glutamate epimerase-like enolase superfamily enzyme
LERGHLLPLQCAGSQNGPEGADLRTSAREVTVHTERTFAIARSSADAFERVVLEVEDGGITGRGEAAPTRYYGQSAAGVAGALRDVEIRDPWDIEGTLVANDHLPPAALAALDAALHDLAAKRLGVPVHRLLGLARPEPTSAYTLGIAELDTTVEEAKKLSSFPILKMKVGGWEDVETVRAVAGISASKIWVDANEAFSPEEAPDVVSELRAIGVGMIEQPVAASAGPEALKTVTYAACRSSPTRAPSSPATCLISPAASAGSTSSSPSALGSGGPLRWSTQPAR